MGRLYHFQAEEAKGHVFLLCENHSVSFNQLNLFRLFWQVML
jgi:hypothetical protein